MKVYVTSKKSMDDLIKTFRNLGYNLITYGTRIAELERDNDRVIIERRKA